MPAHVFLCFALALFITACSPSYINNKQVSDISPVLETSSFISFDGARLPLRHWLASNASAVVIAIHGFNDYSHFINDTANYFAKQGITVYAYDQRGFGAAPNHGRWPGKQTLSRDLKTFTHLIQQRFPDKPVFLLGESMGAAVILHALASDDMTVDGVMLSAPAIWGWDSMPFWQRWGLSLAARIMPSMTFTGESLGVVASDNRDMLIALSQDPLIIKATRVDSIYGLVNLMQAANNGLDSLYLPALIAYGDHDEIIPNPSSSL